MKKENIKKGLVVGLIGVIALGLAGNSLAQEGVDKKRDHKRSPEARQEIKNAVKNNNYEAFQNALPERAQSHVTKENFQKRVEAYNLYQSGDKEKAKEIRDELREGRKEARGLRKEIRKTKRKLRRTEVKKAIEEGNYEAFKASTNGKAVNVNSENFHLLTELKEARDNKNKEKAKEIRSEMKKQGIKGLRKMRKDWRENHSQDREMRMMENG